MAGSYEEALSRISSLDAEMKAMAMRAMASIGTGPQDVRPEVDVVSAEAAISGGVVGSTGGGSPADVPLPDFLDKGETFPPESFRFYQDTDGTYRCSHPLVVVRGVGEISVSEPSYSEGSTYYCHVYQETSGSWDAHIDTVPDTSSGKEDSRVNVKIATIPTGEENPIEQHHTGVIVVTGSSGFFLASFTAYDNNGSVDLFNPLVATPAGIITAGGTTTKLGAGTYYCHVRKAKSGDTYAATVDTSEKDTSVSATEEAVVTTKICKIGTSGEGPDQKTVVEEQYHVGTVVVDGGGGGGKFLASFAVYEGESGLTMFNPVVACPPDTTLTPIAPNPLVAGTYYCHVWRSGDWVYDSNIDTSKSHSGGGKPVLDVKICDIVNGADEKPVLSKQYHVGVICADARTGLRVKSAGSLLTSGMGAGQTGDVSRKVELEFTEKLTKHLAMTVTATGDGKDGATVKLDEDDSVGGTTVVTGFKSLTVDGGKLRLVASTAKIRFPIIEGSEGEATVEMAVSETPVVVESKYDESTGKFTNTVKKATVLALTDGKDNNVFTAVKFPECPSLKDG